MTVVFTESDNADGDRTALSATIGGTADFTNNYAYDGLGQLRYMTQSGTTGGNAVAEKLIDFGYNADGQFSSITRFADLAGTQLVATGTYTYDTAGRLTSLTYTKDQTTLVDHDWTYNSANEITEYINSIDGTAGYTSDDIGQLTGADYDYQTDESYSYDDNGNRTNTGYVTGTNNLLLSDGTYRYTYDDSGNRTAKFVDTDADGVLDSGDTDITTYTWDYRNRLTGVVQTATYGGAVDHTVDYAYDYANRLVFRTVDAGRSGGTVPIQESAYVYDGNQIALQFDKIVGGPSALSASDLSHRYLWGPAVDQLLADEKLSPLPPGEGQGEGFDLSTAGDVVWPLTDNLGTVRDLATYDSNTDVTTIANHRVYDAYGNRTSQTNSAVDCLFGYTARQYDEVSNLQNNLNRWYDAKVGRWVSEDPIGFRGGDANVNRYCQNNSVIYTDPQGEFLGAAIGGIIGGISGSISGYASGGWRGAVSGGIGGVVGGVVGGLLFNPALGVAVAMGMSGALAGAAAGAASGAASGAIGSLTTQSINAGLGGKFDGNAVINSTVSGMIGGGILGGITGGIAKTSGVDLEDGIDEIEAGLIGGVITIGTDIHQEYRDLLCNGK